MALTPGRRRAILRSTPRGAADGPLEPPPGRAGRGHHWAHAGGGVWAAAGQAQSVKVTRVGYLDIGSRTYQQSLREDTFRQALREWGYIERGNLVIEWRFADGNP